MSVVGPTRLILIRSGRYDYGEIEMIRSLHLVGRNNVGKTSLISTLQFLYIDTQQQMHFSRELDKTRQYYFPDRNSYILFECLTPTGFQVLGVQGLGPLKQYGFQRFAYRGRFVLEDFIDAERRIRPEDIIRGSLADRNYTILEPKHLQAALTGIGDNKGVHLGLVPLRDKGQYERFRKIFCNLLKLAHLSQDDLKRFFIDIYDAEFRQKNIDLEQGYSSQYKKVKTGSQEVRDLQNVAEHIRELLSLDKERKELREELPALWKAIEQTHSKEAEEISARKAILKEEHETLTAEQIQVTGRLKLIEPEVSEIDVNLGKLQNSLETLEASANKFKDFLPEFAKTRSAELSSEIGKIGQHLTDAGIERGDQLEQRVQRNKLKIAELKRRLEELSNTTAAALAKMHTEEDINKIFRILNPQLLGIPRGPEGISVINDELVANRLKNMLSCISNDHYEDEALRIALSNVEKPDIKLFTDPWRIEQEIIELQILVQRDEGALRAIAERAVLEERKKALEFEYSSLLAQLGEYAGYQKGLSQEKEWRSNNEAFEKQKIALKREKEFLGKREKDITESLREVGKNITSLSERVKMLESRIHELKPPDRSWWTGKVILELPAAQIEILISRYDESYKKEQEKNIGIDNALRLIAERTYSRYSAESEEQLLRILGEEVDALPQRQEAVQTLWANLAADLRSAFKGLNQDLDTLKSRIDELNRHLSSISVSNLAKLRLIVHDNPLWVGRIRTVIDAEEMPLFSSMEATEQALQALGALLQSSAQVDIFDLFDLQFEVTMTDNSYRTYSSLHQIESQGTNITIKVLVNLMLLKGLLDPKKEVVVPFYLDEASSVDPDNLKSIIDQARFMGFIPILASPEAISAADDVYYLREQAGRVLLEPKISRIRTEREGAQNTGQPGEGTVILP